MQALLANGAAVLWTALLIYAPSLLWSTFRRPTVLMFALSGAATLAVATFATYLIARTGSSPMLALRILGVALALCLIATIVQSVGRGRARRARRERHWGSPQLAVLTGVAIGVWAILPMLSLIHGEDLTFGLVNLGNADQPNYVMAGQNIANSGFADSHHLANVDMGAFTRGTYVGSYTVLLFMSAVTGLSIFQVALPALALGVCLTAVALWAVGRAIWPLAHGEIGLAVVIACLCALPVYNYSKYFFGATIGLAAVATCVAGMIEAARSPGWIAPACIMAGGGLGIYTYGHIQLPVLLILPVAAVLSALVLGVRRARLLGVLARVGGAVVGALLVAGPFVPSAYNLMRSQAQVVAGWSLPPVSGVAATIWPQGIGQASSSAWQVVTWGAIVLGVLLCLLTIVVRDPAARRSALLAGLVFLGCGVVVVGCMVVYGTSRYQTWKMQSFIAPIAAVAGLPAIGLAGRLSTRVGPASVLAALAGAVALVPWLLWAPYLGTANSALMTTGSMVALRDAPPLKDVATLNVRVPGTLETMNLGAILDDKALVFTQNSYYVTLTSMDTCTLTTRDLLPPDAKDFTDLGGGYVLIDLPAPCELKG